MTDRFTEKVARDKRRRTWRMALGAGVVALLGLGTWLVGWSAVFAAQQITVSGVEHLPAADVVAAAQVPLGTPLVRVDLAAIEHRVADLDPVAQVSVERSWPSTVAITVTERTAVAWTRKSGAPWAVDASGVVYRRLASRPDHIPELVVAAGDSRSRHAAATVAGDLVRERPSFAGDVRVIRATSKDAVELDLSGGRVVVWGSAGQGTEKIATLETLLTITARRYDVSAPERPTTTA